MVLYSINFPNQLFLGRINSRVGISLDISTRDCLKWGVYSPYYTGRVFKNKTQWKYCMQGTKMRALYTVHFNPIFYIHVLRRDYVMLCYVIWLFVKRLSQEAIQRRSQRDRLVKIKVFKLRRDADDILCNITLRSAGGESIIHHELPLELTVGLFLCSFKYYKRPNIL